MSQPSERLYFVTILARPHHENPEYGRFSGAYVNCWIDEASNHAAVARAETEIRGSGWIPESIEKVVLVTRDSCDDTGNSREYFEQALIDKSVLVFHTFPAKPDDEDLIH